jgi:hypothetical protein
MCVNRLIDQFIYSIINPIFSESMLNIECVIVSLCGYFYRLFINFPGMVLMITYIKLSCKHDLPG